ncbi:HlyD family secretion protein [Mucilaginibacter terrae]|uniref:HlyD family secretion protein n=1 Tax=Mucilaginibacter terrae TaxID=1955052 RepID=UPI003633E5D7
MKTFCYHLIIISLFSVALAGCSGEGTDNAQLEADISPVIPKVNSTVTAVRVGDNQPVKKGDVLIVLDTATFKIAVSQAEIALAQAEKNVALADNNKTSASVNVSNVTANSDAVATTLTAAEADIASAKEQLQVAERNFDRYAKLLEQKSATQQQFEQFKANKAEAEAKLQSVVSKRNSLLKQIKAGRLEIANTRTQVSNTSEGISIARLAVKQAQVNLDAAKLQLSYCTIKAPANGIVSKKNVQVGQVVAIGEPLMAIANDNQVWVIANFKETQIEKMRVGQEVDIDVDAYSDTTFHGKVESFSQATGARFSFLPADNATGNFVKVTQRIPVKISMVADKNMKYPLRAGMSVNAKVKTN